MKKSISIVPRLSIGQTRLEFESTMPYLRSAYCDSRSWFSEGPVIAWCCLEGETNRVKAIVHCDGKSFLQHDTRLVYPCSAVYSGQTLAKFALAYEVCSEGFKVELCAVEHIDNYRLLEVEIPHLLVENHPEAQLIKVSEGRVFQLSEEKNLQASWNAGDVLVPHAVLLTPDSLAVLGPASTAEDIIMGINKGPSKSMAYLGAVLRVGREGKQFLPVQNSSSVRINFFVRKKSCPPLRWTDAAKLIREEVPHMLDDMYINGMVYKIFCDDPTWHKPTSRERPFDFKKLSEFFKLANRLTDGTLQVVYLVGWQNEGHDSKYPYIEQVNPCLGTHQELLELFEIAKQNNIILSFHDDYDLAYLDSPAWDEKTIAIDSNGNLMKGGIWSGGQSYWIGCAKYVTSGKAVKRIEKTLSLYPICKSYHLDVLSGATYDDFDFSHPAASPSNIEAKHQIIREFNRRGIDLTSEFVSWFFRDVQRHGFHLLTKGTLLESLPILSFIFHGRMTYGSFKSQRGQTDAENDAIGILQGGTWDGDALGVLKVSAWGPGAIRIVQASIGDNDLFMNTVVAQLCKAFYKYWVPFHALARREMQDYVDQPHPKVIYDNDSYVELPTPDTYRVVVDGTEIANERYSVYRKSEHCFLAWSEKGCGLLFGNWLPDVKTVSTLNLATGEESSCGINQRLLLNPGQPVKIESKF